MKRVTFWLAYPDTPKGGISRVLDEIEALGIGACLSVRVGQAGRIENGADEKMVQKCIDRLGASRVEIWWGSHPTTISEEVRLAKRYHAIGIRRFVANAETAWKRDGAEAVARRLSDDMLENLIESELGHAPFALMMSHGIGAKPFPYLGFAKLHKAFLQLYPNEFGGSRAYWYGRYEREVKAFLGANPALAAQKIVAMGDLYGSDFGRSWGLTPSPVKWDDSHLEQHLALSDRMGDAEWAFYSVDAALSESERHVKGQVAQSSPWDAVKRWAERLRAKQEVAPITQPDPNGYYDNKKAICVMPENQSRMKEPPE